LPFNRYRSVKRLIRVYEADHATPSSAG
jgi:hypothetical protein